MRRVVVVVAYLPRGRRFGVAGRDGSRFDGFHGVGGGC
jgi:hypothetical protein